MGRRRKSRKQRVVRPKRTLPTIFQCPYCGRKTLTVEVNKRDPHEALATVRCGSCGFFTRVTTHPMLHPVDVYAKVLDMYDEGRLEYEIRVPEEERVDVEGEGS